MKRAEGTFKEGKDWSYVHLGTSSGYPFGTYRDKGWIKGIADGKWTFWHVNEKKRAEGNYKNGNGVGSWTWWYENGQKALEGTFKSYSGIYVSEFSGTGSNASEPVVAGVAYGEWTSWYSPSNGGNIAWRLTIGQNNLDYASWHTTGQRRQLWDPTVEYHTREQIFQ